MAVRREELQIILDDRFTRQAEILESQIIDVDQAGVRMAKSLEQSSNRAADAMERSGRAAARSATGKRAATAASRGLQRQSNRTNAAITQLSFGLQDVATVLAIGGGWQRAIVSASNNLGFMASILSPGMAGAAAGLAVTLGSTLVPMLLSTALGAKRAAEDEKKLETATEKAADAASRAAEAQAKAQRERRALAGVTQEQFQAEADLDAASRALAANQTDLTAKLQGVANAQRAITESEDKIARFRAMFAADSPLLTDAIKNEGEFQRRLNILLNEHKELIEAKRVALMQVAGVQARLADIEETRQMRLRGLADAIKAADAAAQQRHTAEAQRLLTQEQQRDAAMQKELGRIARVAQAEIDAADAKKRAAQDALDAAVAPPEPLPEQPGGTPQTRADELAGIPRTREDVLAARRALRERQQREQRAQREIERQRRQLDREVGPDLSEMVPTQRLGRAAERSAGEGARTAAAAVAVTQRVEALERTVEQQRRFNDQLQRMLNGGVGGANNRGIR